MNYNVQVAGYVFHGFPLFACKTPLLESSCIVLDTELFMLLFTIHTIYVKSWMKLAY